MSAFLERLKAARLPPIESTLVGEKRPGGTKDRIDPDEQMVSLVASTRIQVVPYYSRLGIEGAGTDLMVRHSVAIRLTRAGNCLPPGFALAVLDGWRSAGVQRAIHARLRQTARESGQDPAKYSFDLDCDHPQVYPTDDAPHRTGGAVDVTLIDPLGASWPMGGEFDEPSQRSMTRWYESSTGDAAAQLGRRALFYAMMSAGFSNYPEEWWHFDFGNAFWRYYAGLPEDTLVFRTVER